MGGPDDNQRSRATAVAGTHLHDPAVRVVEVDVSRSGYDEWHIPGAVHWDVYRDLKDAEYRTVDAAATERLLARSGIDPDSTVVFYGYAPALGFWLLKLYGTPTCASWTARGTRGEGKAVPRAARPSNPPAPDTSCPNPTERSEPTTRRCETPSARTARSSWTCAAGMSTGASASGPPAAWTVPAGPVRPVAVHQPIDGLYDERGSFRTATDLRQSSPASTWTARMS